MSIFEESKEYIPPKLKKSKLISELHNLVCCYLFNTEFPNLEESLVLHILNSKFYPYDKYIQDSLNYKEYIFNTIYEAMSENDILVANLNQILEQFKCYNLVVPTNKLSVYDKGILRTTIKNKKYEIILADKFLSVKGKKCYLLSFYNLSLFWKLIYVVLWFDTWDSEPLHLFF